MRDFCKDLLWLISGGTRETMRQRDRLKAQVTETLGALQQSREREQALSAELEKIAAVRPLPFMMLNTLPKSGSAYLFESLRLGLRITGRPVSCGYFPFDLIDYQKIKEASLGRAIAQEHFDAHPTNLQLLKEFCPRLIVHLREPRQALLSWVHQMIRNLALGHRHTLFYVTPSPPVSAFEHDLSGIIDWHLDNHLPNMLEWMEAWMIHAESGELPIVKFTYFEDMQKKPADVVLAILDYYNISASYYMPQDVPKSELTHFRKGLVDEWRHVFTPAQQDAAARLISCYPRVSAKYAPGAMQPQMFEQSGVVS